MKFLLMLVFALSSAMAVQVDLENSEIRWKGKKVTGEHYGTVPLKSAKVKMTKGQLESGTFVADLQNFTVDDLKGEWATKFLTHMKSSDFFEVEKYPTATLKVTNVSKNNVTADLTIKGKTNSVKFKFDETKGGYVGTVKFDRTKFDMVYGSGNFFKNLGDKTIDDTVELTYKIVLMN